MVKPVIIFGLEVILLTAKKMKLKVAQFKMLRFSLGVTRTDETRNR